MPSLPFASTEVAIGLRIGFPNPRWQYQTTPKMGRAKVLRGVVVNAFLHGTVHAAQDDFQLTLQADPHVLALWQALTPLGRNEFICWVDDAKQSATRQRRMARAREELLEGKKRPCCWVGCIHRTDKAPSRWQQAVLIDGKGRPARRE